VLLLSPVCQVLGFCYLFLKNTLNLVKKTMKNLCLVRLQTIASSTTGCEIVGMETCYAHLLHYLFLFSSSFFTRINNIIFRIFACFIYVC